MSQPVDAAAAARVCTWLEANAVAIQSPISFRLLTGGRSNLTYEVTDGAGHRYVLRTPPRGNTAWSHDVAREYEILTALSSSAVPVPRPLALCSDAAVLGGAFYVVDFVDGQVMATRADGGQMDPGARAAASTAIVEGLAGIHAVRPAEVGLDGLGKGHGYVERQLVRWSAQAASMTGPGSDIVQEAGRLLTATTPTEQRVALVHGDYKFANVMLGVDGSLRAVLDWELATLGDPLVDLGGLLAMWPDPDEAPLVESPTSNPGFHTRTEVVKLYTDLTGADASDVEWYSAFALWKISCLLSGVVARYRAGVMGEDDFDIAGSEQLVINLAEAVRSRL